MSDQKETALELNRLLKKRDINKNAKRDLLEEKRITVNKLRRIKERIGNINQEIERDEATIQHFLELLERRTTEDSELVKLLKTIISHPYVTKLAENDPETNQISRRTSIDSNQN